MPVTAVIGTAGWSIASGVAGPTSGGSALERYARLFSGVEVNSSFHRSHRLATWQRWSQSVAPSFRFAVKLPKTITHVARLRQCEALVAAFAGEVAGLGEKLAVCLVQLPPKLAFDPAVVEQFFSMLAAAVRVQLVCEPRHPGWFEEDADRLLKRLRIARVAADPACVAIGQAPGGWHGFAYRRLHGSPQIYRSSYDDGRLEAIAAELEADRQAGRPSWCMFDNTASRAAAGDARALAAMLGGAGAAYGKASWMPDEDSNLD